MSKTQKKPVTIKSAATKKPAATVTKGAKPMKPEAKVTNVKETNRNPSKQNILVRLLQRSSGATAEEMVKATGWQKHSVLGAISGVLRKRLGLIINSDKEERGRVYRVAGAR